MNAKCAFNSISYIFICLVDSSEEEPVWAFDFEADKFNKVSLITTTMFLAALKQTGLIGDKTFQLLSTETGSVDMKRTRSKSILTIVLFILKIVNNSRSKIFEAMCALRDRASKSPSSTIHGGLQFRLHENSRNLQTLPNQTEDNPSNERPINGQCSLINSRGKDDIKIIWFSAVDLLGCYQSAYFR